MRNSLSTCPTSSVAASFWPNPKRLRCEKEAEPMKPGRAPSAAAWAEMPPPAESPP